MDQPPAETSVPQKRPLRLGRKRKWLFRGVAVLGSVLLIELVSWVSLKTMDSKDITLRTLHEWQHSLAMGRGLSEASTEVIHPYLGWVHNPQTAVPEDVFGKRVSVNPLGFQNNDAALPKRSKDTFVVGVFGGSVGWHVGIVGEATLREVLESHPLLAGKTVEVHALAKPGYKQPQQLLAYNYLAALGAEFDAVVNIDGYNEVALSVQENFENKTSIAYPRSWHARALLFADPKNSAEAARLLQLRAHRQRIAQQIDNSVLKWSWTANFVWYLRNARVTSDLNDFAFSAITNRSENFIFHGPADSFANQDEMRRGVVDLWSRSSLQFHRSCIAAGTIYVHVLQPNQYHEGSKPMGPEERQIAISPPTWEDTPIRAMYPLVIEAGKELAGRGVRFSDQTLLFADMEEPIYIDTCCHYNETGIEMLSREVAKELLAALRQQNASQ